MRLRPPRPGDLSRALRLSALAGWNQTALDWQAFAQHGTLRMRDDGGEALAATVATLPFGPVTWISMVLVRPDLRRQGMATGMMRWALRSLRGTPCVALDATPEGSAVYARLGFRDAWGFSRWQVPRVPAMPGARPMRDEDWPGVVALDAAAFGAGRGWLLGKVCERPGFVVEKGGLIVGAILCRDGARTPHAGPLLAREPGIGMALVAAALPEGGILDLRDDAAISGWLRAHHGTPLRGFTRMVRGGDLPGDASGCMAVLGPEFG